MVAVRQTLAVAAEKGVRVVVTLTDQWGECGDGGASKFKTKDWYLGGYNVPDPVLAAKYAQWVSYRDWVTEVVTRYRDNPTILAWQLVNEAEVKDAVDAGCPVGAHPQAFGTGPLARPATGARTALDDISLQIYDAGSADKDPPDG